MTPVLPSASTYRSPDPRWAAIAARLREKPGEWELVGRHSASQVTRIKNGELAAFRPAGTFEATCRDKGARGRADIYARYVGERNG